MQKGSRWDMVWVMEVWMKTELVLEGWIERGRAKRVNTRKEGGARNGRTDRKMQR